MPAIDRSLSHIAYTCPRLIDLSLIAGTLLGDEPGWDETQTDSFLQGYLGPNKDHYENNDVYLLLKKNAAKIRGNLRTYSGEYV